MKAAVLQDHVEADAAAARVGRNRRRRDRHFGLKRVVDEALRAAFVALHRHALDLLLAVEAAEPARAQPHLLGGLDAADVGRAGPHAGRQHAKAHDVARDGQRVDDVARDDRGARRLLHVDLRRRSGDVDGFLERAHPQFG
jgi:hypothetical protein